jgi:hypothetical protein
MTKISIEEAQEFLEAIGSDAIRFRVAMANFEETGNPLFAWTAIQLCIEHEKQFPDLLLGYLLQCAMRMLSDDAKKEGRDLRKILPFIFGFPNAFDLTRKRRGPGNLLDPGDGDAERMKFALIFASRLEKGEKVSVALRNACNEVFSGKKAEVDDKTLRSWLQKEFELNVQPTTVEDWKRAARDHFKPMKELMVAWEKSRETPS